MYHTNYISRKPVKLYNNRQPLFFPSLFVEREYAQPCQSNRIAPEREPLPDTTQNKCVHVCYSKTNQQPRHVDNTTCTMRALPEASTSSASDVDEYNAEANWYENIGGERATVNQKGPACRGEKEIGR